MKAILVIDDSISIRSVSKMALAHLGRPIIEAADGAEALELLRQQSVALIISDINMPHMSGLELLKRVKKDETLEHIPFVMLTTEGSRDAVAQARAFGARAWIMKPFKTADLVATVENILAAET